MSDYFYLNGTLVLSRSCHIPAADRSYLLGDGLFETILVQQSKAVYLAEHLNRLNQSAGVFAYRLPAEEALAEAINSVIEANALETAALRLTVSPKESEGLLAKANSPLNILVTFRYGIPYPATAYEQGLNAVIAASTRRNEHSPLARHKTTNFLDSILAKQEANARGADEAILLNTAGNLTEATVANLFLVVNGEVLTPPLADGVLPGIVRAKVLEHCRIHNIPAREETLSPQIIGQAGEAFLTNSLMTVMPLRRIGEHTLATAREGSVSTRLAALLPAY